MAAVLHLVVFYSLVYTAVVNGAVTYERIHLPDEVREGLNRVPFTVAPYSTKDTRVDLKNMHGEYLPQPYIKCMENINPEDKMGCDIHLKVNLDYAIKGGYYSLLMNDTETHRFIHNNTEPEEKTGERHRRAIRSDLFPSGYAAYSRYTVEPPQTKHYNMFNASSYTGAYKNHRCVVEGTNTKGTLADPGNMKLFVSDSFGNRLYSDPVHYPIKCDNADTCYSELPVYLPFCNREHDPLLSGEPYCGVEVDGKDVFVETPQWGRVTNLYSPVTAKECTVLGVDIVDYYVSSEFRLLLNYIQMDGLVSNDPFNNYFALYAYGTNATVKRPPINEKATYTIGGKPPEESQRIPDPFVLANTTVYRMPIGDPALLRKELSSRVHVPDRTRCNDPNGHRWEKLVYRVVSLTTGTVNDIVFRCSDGEKEPIQSTDAPSLQMRWTHGAVLGKYYFDSFVDWGVGIVRCLIEVDDNDPPPKMSLDMSNSAMSMYNAYPEKLKEPHWKFSVYRASFHVFIGSCMNIANSTCRINQGPQKSHDHQYTFRIPYTRDDCYVPPPNSLGPFSVENSDLLYGYNGTNPAEQTIQARIVYMYAVELYRARTNGNCVSGTIDSTYASMYNSMFTITLRMNLTQSVFDPGTGLYRLNMREQNPFIFQFMSNVNCATAISTTEVMVLFLWTKTTGDFLMMLPLQCAPLTNNGAFLSNQCRSESSPPIPTK